MQNDTIARTARTDGGFGASPLGELQVGVVRVSADWLVGTWRLFRADPSLDFAPGVRMEFADGGVLRYHIDVAGNDQVVDLIYRIEGDTLHTENLIEPHSMSVQFAREGEDVLALDFGGASAWLMREYDDES